MCQAVTQVCLLNKQEGNVKGICVITGENSLGERSLFK